MGQEINRAQFLRGDLSGKKGPIRPPWALPEAEFTSLCSGCGDCIKSCFDQILVEGRGRLPQVNFQLGGCDFCGDCLDACKTGALKRDDGAQPWSLRAEINSSCLSLNSVDCRACGDACEPRAIRFQLRVGAVAMPQLDSDSCTGCGACIGVCPVQSIEIHSNRKRSQAA